MTDAPDPWCSPIFEGGSLGTGSSGGKNGGGARKGWNRGIRIGRCYVRPCAKKSASRGRGKRLDAEFKKRKNAGATKTGKELDSFPSSTLEA